MKTLKMSVLLLLASSVSIPATEPLAQRIGHTDPSKYNRSRSHNGAGEMACELLVPPTELNTNLNFMHRCQMMPGGGVGHHFHNRCEEMFIILNGEAEFTIDGRTSLLKGPVGAPCVMGHSHAIYNPTGRPVEFININVSAIKGRYDAFNLNDSRVGAAKDPIPVFMTMRLDKQLLHPVTSYHGGEGTAMYRRALGPEVFLTNWAYVDHVVLPPATSEGRHRHRGVEEIYYVMDGNGEVQVNLETAPIHTGDAVPVRMNEIHAVRNTGSRDLELMVVGIATQKDVLDTEEVK